VDPTFGEGLIVTTVYDRARHDTAFKAFFDSREIDAEAFHTVSEEEDAKLENVLREVSTRGVWP
jgi:hypothetical protein